MAITAEAWNTTLEQIAGLLALMEIFTEAENKLAERLDAVEQRLDVDQQHLSILDDASLEREEALRARVAELEEKVTRLAAIVANQQEAIVNLTNSKAG